MTRPFRRLPRVLAVWLPTCAFVLGVYLVYRWAEPSPASIAAVMSPGPVNKISLELEDAAFENFANGTKNWSLRAGHIRLERPTATGVANALLAADIDNIQDGKFFAGTEEKREEGRGKREEREGRGKREKGKATASQRSTPTNTPNTHEYPIPTNAQQPPPNALITQSSADAASGRPIATFAAQNGRYMVSDTSGIPPDMLLSYTVLWQFRLTGDVRIRTREGYLLNAPAITMVELFNRHTGRTERQMLCSEGARVKAGSTQLQANIARYSDASHSVECQGGVRGTMRTVQDKQGKEVNEDSFQSETMQWSLKDNVVSCPQTTSGVWESLPYTASDIRIDVQRHVYTGNNLVMQIRDTSKLAAGSLGLLMASAAVSQVPGGKNSVTSAPSAASTSITQDKRPTFRADHSSMENHVVKAQGFTYETLNETGKRTITGTNATYYDDKGVLDADTNLVMDDPEYHATCQKAHVEEKKALAIMTGDVVMVLKPEKQAGKTTGSAVPKTGEKVAPPTGSANGTRNASGEDGDKTGTDDPDSLTNSKKQGATVTCDQVESYYKRKFNTLTGHLTFKQKIERKGKPVLERTVHAEHATYDAKAEVLILFPPVDGADNEGGEFISKTDKVTIETHSGKETMRGENIEMKLPPIKEEPDAENDATPAKPGTPPDTKKPATPTKK